MFNRLIAKAAAGEMPNPNHAVATVRQKTTES